MSVQICCKAVVFTINMPEPPDFKAVVRELQNDSPNIISELFLMRLGEHTPMPPVGNWELIFFTFKKTHKKITLAMAIEAGIKLQTDNFLPVVTFLKLMQLGISQKPVIQFSETFPCNFVVLGTRIELNGETVYPELTFEEAVADGHRWIFGHRKHTDDFADCTFVGWRKKRK